MCAPDSQLRQCQYPRPLMCQPTKTVAKAHLEQILLKACSSLIIIIQVLLPLPMTFPINMLLLHLIMNLIFAFQQFCLYSSPNFTLTIRCFVFFFYPYCQLSGFTEIYFYNYLFVCFLDCFFFPQTSNFYYHYHLNNS